MIKAIETVYNGYRFRSRLEARWAVFFDTLGVKYEYEKEGYDLNGTWYLPDFWLSELDCFVEIKGQKPTWEEISKAFLLAWNTDKLVYILWGAIGLPDHENGILSFGRIGFHCNDYEDYLETVSIEEFRLSVARFNGINPNALPPFKGLIDLNEVKNILLKSMQAEIPKADDLLLYWDFEQWASCPFCKKISIQPYGYCTTMPCNCCKLDGWAEEHGHKTNNDSPQLTMAYNAGRQARFEHGENTERASRGIVMLPDDDPHGIAQDKASDIDRQYFLEHPDETEYRRPFIPCELSIPSTILPDEILVKQYKEGLRFRIPQWCSSSEASQMALGQYEKVRKVIEETDTRTNHPTTTQVSQRHHKKKRNK